MLTWDAYDTMCLHETVWAARGSLELAYTYTCQEESSSSSTLTFVQLEVGFSLGADKRHSLPADILVQNWIIGKPAAFDLMVTSLLNPTI